MSKLRDRLVRDHEQLHAILNRLAEDVEAPSSAPLRGTWDKFERRLLAHMKAEEELLLPLLEASHPGEVLKTRDEHEVIRKRVAELGVMIELHCVRKAAIVELIELLERHAAREDRGLYQIAGERASTAVEHSIGRAVP